MATSNKKDKLEELYTRVLIDTGEKLTKEELEEMQKLIDEDEAKKDDKYIIMDNGEKLTKEQYEELQKLTEDLTDSAKAMVEDYKDNPSEYSGSVDVEKGLVKGDGVTIHEDSPLLEDDKEDIDETSD